MIQSITLFMLAGLCEIAGGYLVWLCLREGKSIWLALLGACVLALYGVVPTYQPSANFGRIYAAYGGVFVVMSMLWGWKIEGKTPDAYDLIGSTVCIIGIAVIMYAPRSS